MATAINITTTAAIDIVHVDGGIPKVETTGTSDVFKCSNIYYDANESLVGVLNGDTQPVSGSYVENDQVVIPDGQEANYGVTITA